MFSQRSNRRANLEGDKPPHDGLNCIDRERFTLRILIIDKASRACRFYREESATAFKAWRTCVMSIRSKPLFRHAMIGAAALVAATGWFGAPPARSQSHSGAALPPAEIERMIGARGYRLTGPVVRHGKVYIANVLGPEDDVEQLVVDARDGHLLRQSAGGAPVRPQGGNPNGWSPLSGIFGALFGPPEDAAPLSPPPASDFYENPKPKAQIKRSKLVQPANVPGDAKAPASTPDAATPGVTTPGATTPGAATPSAAAPSVTPPPVAAAKAAPTTSPETATAAPGAAASKAPATKLNDVPVAPLE
jgi:hypothetical protein